MKSTTPAGAFQEAPPTTAHKVSARTQRRRNRLSSFTLAAAVLIPLVCNVQHVLSAIPNSETSPYQMVTWWGANRAWRETLDHQERSLGELCLSSPYTIVNLANMVDHFSTRGYPALDFSMHCNWSTSAYPGFGQTTDGVTLLKCPDIEQDIQTCQKLGKKVLLSISPYHETLKSDEDGIRSADNVWALFFNSNSTIRPFGAAVLDGVDLYQRTNEKGYLGFVQRLRSLMDADTTKPYYISVSPECSFPSVRVGPTYPDTILATNASLVDWINVMHLASQVCSWGSVDRAGFWSAVQQWGAWAASSGTGIQFFTGLPIWGWGFESWVNGMVGDFLYPDELYRENAVGKLKSYKSFGGFALWDDSYEFSNFPCENSQDRYSQILYNELKTAQVGADSSATKTCVLRKSTPTIVAPSVDPPRTTAKPQPTGTTSGGSSNTTCTAWWCNKGNSSSGSSATDSPSTPSDGSGNIAGLPPAAIGGIIAGVVTLGLVGLIAGIFWCRKRRTTPERRDSGDRSPRTGTTEATPDQHQAEKLKAMGASSGTVVKTNKIAPVNRNQSRLSTTHIE